ncbi:Peptidase M16-like protein [Nitrosococcus oceani ATCC 19707]|uniref:Peptidase M16-like protein n=2 Tax=Nitrosococcus oceani TaxID=1229 RepID=Q3J9V1_NITOC|nr:pitrilysin family protein [Nitrosococcus oceani]ABA58395.1 Peptidase M16-like protein [Nitrosococcus oceani ATCC 19707]KFI19203.1 peptidase M16 [Nitrosococcus oceani C-27]GEM18789.1 peptidase M16 [Nitrosococcus oceani]
MTPLIRLLTIFLALMLPLAVMAKVHEFTLKNGLKLLVKEDPRAPVMVSQVWYKVGSSYEYNGITGISHMLEHMMFKGTKNLEPNQFSQIISANGGEENAFTGRDYTAYFEQMANDQVEVSFRLEADRMRNLVLIPEELRKEKQVVMEERRMRTEDNPNALTYERFNATAFLSGPYHHPVIGWMSDIQHYELKDLQAWYQKWYAPNNATVVVVGDVDPEAVHALAEKYFGSLKPEKITPPKPQEEISQTGRREIFVRAPAELPYLLLGWKVPVIKNAEEDWEAYALEVLGGILDGGRSSRFSRELIRGSQVATSVGASYHLYGRIKDQFVIAGVPAQGRTIAELEEAIWAQIQRLQKELVSKEELERIKNQVVAHQVFEQDSMFFQAMQLGLLETVGLDWRLADAYVDQVRAITPEQVQAVAQKYLLEARLTRAELVPLPIEPGEKAPSTQPVEGGRHVS